MSFCVHYFTNIFLIVPTSVLSVLSVLIAHYDISVLRCTLVWSLFQITLPLHTKSTLVYHVHEGTQYTLWWALFALCHTGCLLVCTQNTTCSGVQYTSGFLPIGAFLQCQCMKGCESYWAAFTSCPTRNGTFRTMTTSCRQWRIPCMARMFSVCILQGKATLHCARWKQLSLHGQVQKLQHCGAWDETQGYQEGCPQDQQPGRRGRELPCSGCWLCTPCTPSPCCCQVCTVCTSVQWAHCAHWAHL